MRAILSIFDYYTHQPYQQYDKVGQTLAFLSARSNNFPHFAPMIREIGDFLTRLRKEAPFTLTNNGVTIDVLELDKAMKGGLIDHYYKICSEVRTELMNVSEQDDFRTLKRLNDYWHTLEMIFDKMIKSPQ